MFGIAQSLIGASIIAIGTSLPELAVTLSAARQKKYTLIIGNAIGSAMTNVGLILGLILVLTPFVIDATVFSNLVTFLILTNIMLWYFISNEKIERIEGIAFVIFYQIFLIISFIVGI
jgi:cation:H+ antiporter